MTDLITRIETESPSRELESDLMQVFGWEFRKISDPVTGPEWVWVKEGNIRLNPIPFLTNLQDAVALVPEGWNWRIASNGYAEVWDGKRGLFYGGYKADSPATALTIACLRAAE